MPGDYDGDGTVDIAIFRGSNGLWAVDGGLRDYFGGTGDVPIPGISAGGGGGGLWSSNGDKIYYNSGYVGIGNLNPRFSLDIHKNSSYYSYARFTNQSTGTGSGDGVLVGIDPNEDFRIHSYEDNNIKFFINNDEKVRIASDGDVGIGTSDPYARLHIQESTTGHVVRIDNTSSDSNADVLMLRINREDPGNNNEYIQFYQDVGIVGAIRGKGDGGVQYYSTVADFAECLPRSHPDEVIGAGDIVGLSGGKVSKTTRGAEQVQVISSGSIVLGNHPGKEKEHLYEEVAFLGQAPVQVKGTVRSGDYIVPSGLNDGVGVAVSPENLTSDHCARIVGRAWEASEADGVKLINTSVGLKASTQAMQEMGLRKDKKIEELSARLEALERMMQDKGEAGRP